MMDLLTESISNGIYRDKRNLEYVYSMNHITNFKKDYGIPRYAEQVYGDRFRK